MGLRFLVIGVDGTLAGRLEDITLAINPIVVGREEQADLVLPDPAVSRRHLVIRSAKDGCEVEDLGSRLGTRLNGSFLLPGQAVPFREGDELEIGAFRVVFAGFQDAAASPNTRDVARALARQLIVGSAGGGQPPYLRVENGPGVGARHAVQPGARLRVGRGKECEVAVDDARVSRVHAVVYYQEGTVWIADAGSANGSFVDGTRADKPAALRDGSRVQVGRIRMLLVEPEARRWELAAVLDTGKRIARPMLLPSLLALVLGASGLVVALLL